jgi:integrase
MQAGNSTHSGRKAKAKAGDTRKNDDTRTTPGKPSKDFPLFLHRNGQWAKKVRGRLLYFGTEPFEARDRWLAEREYWLAGRRPPPVLDPDALTLERLVNLFCESKESKVKTGHISKRSYDDYNTECKRLVSILGRGTSVEHLTPDDFRTLREKLAKGVSAKTLEGRMTRAKSIFLFAERRGYINGSMRAKMADEFDKPPKAVIEREKGDEVKAFEASEIRLLLASANVNMKAMILLAINGGLGNTDCATLELGNLDLECGWLRMRRQKTGKPRRVPLWSETVQALRDVLEYRPEPSEPTQAVFITKMRNPYSCTTRANPISAEFRKLRESVGIEGNRNFYALRHTFQSVADSSREFIAVKAIMGHADHSISGQYREFVSDERLSAAVDYVRAWLWPSEPKKTAKKTPAKGKKGGAA